MNPTSSFAFDNGQLTALPLLVDDAADDARGHDKQNKGEMPMESLLRWVGRLAGLAGIVLCTWVYKRVAGSYFAGGFQFGTLLQAGMAAILIGCLCLLIVLTNRPPR
jgi:hypothetical protein